MSYGSGDLRLALFCPVGNRVDECGGGIVKMSRYVAVQVFKDKLKGPISAGAAVGPAGLARDPVTSGRRGRGRLPHPLNRRRPIHAPRPLRAAPGRHGRILLVRAVEVASRHRWEPRDTRVVPGERREASRGYRRVACAGALAGMGVAQIHSSFGPETRTRTSSALLAVWLKTTGGRTLA